MSNRYDRFKVAVPEGESGPWRVERFEVDMGSIEAWRCQAAGRPIEPGTYTRLIRNHSFGGPMMSDTPAEIDDLFDVIYRARGRVLINGLGLGVVLKAVLTKPEVTHIDMVEIDEDILKLVAPSYQDPRVTFHHGDAYTIEWPKDSQWNVVWHDIWPNICTDNLEGMTRLHRKYAKRCRWQDSWCKEYAKDLRRRGW